MIGLTLVTLVAVLGVEPRHAATESAIKKQVHADYVIDGKDGLPFRAAEGDALARVRGRRRAPRTSAPTRRSCDGKERTVTGIDPATIAHFYHVQVGQGLRARARQARRPTARS